jgi:hypothetical protein
MSAPKGETRTVKTYVTTATGGLSPEAEQLLHQEKLVANLMAACGARQVAPSKPFVTAQDFYGHVLQLAPAPNERAKADQIAFLHQAVKLAEKSQIPATAQCIANCFDVTGVD